MASMAEDYLSELPEELTATLPDELQEDRRTTCLIRFDRRTQENQMDWNLTHDCTTCFPKTHLEFEEECFMVSRGERVKDLMKHALQSARRMSWPVRDASAMTRQAKGHEQTTFPPVASSPEFEAVHFAEEEGSDEAILETGASRTIIGSNRVEPLLKSLKGVGIKRGPSKCVFRFGNCGLLQSTEALFLERSGKGWLRVEVVPGNTPFLISNAVVEGMRGVVDPHLCELRFHGSRDVIRLRKVRRRLNCVRIRDLLRVVFEDGTGETCLHTLNVQTVNNTDTTQTHPEHGMHDRIHNECTSKPKQALTRDPVKAARISMMETNNSIERQPLTQACKPSDPRESHSPDGAQEDGPAVPIGGTLRGGGLVIDKQGIGREVDLQSAERDSQSPSVGTRDIREWQAQEEGIQRGLPERPAVCPVHPREHEVGIQRHAEFSELLQGHEKEDVPADGHAGTHSSSKECHLNNVEQDGFRVGAHRCRITHAGDKDAGVNTGQEAQPGRTTVHLIDAGRTQLSTCTGVTNTDGNSPERVRSSGDCERDGSPRGLVRENDRTIRRGKSKDKTMSEICQQI